MRSWEALHCGQVKQAISFFFKNCPTLEEVEWYPLKVKDSTSTKDFDLESASVWRWKLRRGHESSPLKITGTLLYGGTSRLKFPFFEILLKCFILPLTTWARFKRFIWIEFKPDVRLFGKLEIVTSFQVVAEK